MLTKTQLTTMLELQDRLNCVINPDWRKANYPWHRAIMVESVECLEHFGWKWWKKQEPDLAQARIELVDIWHFALSMSLQGSLSTDQCVDSLTSRFIEADQLKSAYEGHSTQAKLDGLVRHAAEGRFSATAFRCLMRDFELTWDELYTTYIAKNVLNMFRQDHGYKAGSYRKDWMGMEDNVVLDTLMSTKPDATPELLYTKLEQVYANVLATPITA